jgi:hypothetical protein
MKPLLVHLIAVPVLACPFIAAPVLAQPAPSATGIYTCTNAAGRRLTSDRPIAECNDREQRVLNSDGSVRTTLRPPMTSEERAAHEEAESRNAQERVGRREAVRRDRNLMARYPSEAAHAKARAAALSAVNDGVKASEKRVADLIKERKPLLDEAEFYRGKSMPPKLKSQLESVEVSIEAQRSLAENQKVEIQRVNALYDAELERLRKLWGGAEPGSLGPPPQVAELPMAQTAASATGPAKKR